jgi:hypothetical protein
MVWLFRRVPAALAATVVVALAGCSLIHVSHNTRYYVTDQQAGATVSLKRGDEVTFNLAISTGHDWTAVSSDTSVARPASIGVMHFSSGETSRLIDFSLVGAGTVMLTACPSGSGPCQPSTPGAIAVEVDVT